MIMTPVHSCSHVCDLMTAIHWNDSRVCLSIVGCSLVISWFIKTVDCLHYVNPSGVVDDFLSFPHPGLHTFSGARFFNDFSRCHLFSIINCRCYHLVSDTLGKNRYMKEIVKSFIFYTPTLYVHRFNR